MFECVVNDPRVQAAYFLDSTDFAVMKVGRPRTDRKQTVITGSSLCSRSGTQRVRATHARSGQSLPSAHHATGWKCVYTCTHAHMHGPWHRHTCAQHELPMLILRLQIWPACTCTCTRVHAARTAHMAHLIRSGQHVHAHGDPLIRSGPRCFPRGSRRVPAHSSRSREPQSKLASP